MNNRTIFAKGVAIAVTLLSVSMAFADSGSAPAAPIATATAEQKLSDLDQLVTMIKAGYGPIQYKKEKLKIDVDALRTIYAQKLAATKSNGEYYYTILQFIAEFKDGHFRASLPTDRVSSLPFETDLVDGKVLIDNVNRDLLSEDEFPYEKGDEVVSVDGKPIKDVLDQLQSYRGLGYDLSQRRLAATEIALRKGARVPAPEGDVLFQFRRGTSAVVSAPVKLTWDVKGQSVDEVLMSMGSHPIHFGDPAAAQLNFDDLSISGMFKELKNPQVPNSASYSCSGTTRIAIPDKATIIMQDPFVAYYYPTAQGNIGYLRIPHYEPEDGDFDKRFSQYEYAVSVLEKNTVGLVIDQDHNCGGSVQYLHRILSLFLDKAQPEQQFTLLANKEEYDGCVAEMKEAGDFTIAEENISKVCDLIKTSWLKGDFMTPKTAIDGAPLVMPNDVRYTKPMVMLIDEMSGSGGDAFPSLMQGYGRAKLIGTRTMGLGGHVVAQAALNYSQITPEMTKSLFYRPDGVAIENNGSVPDYPYAITRDDFMYGYQGYRAFYESKLFALLPAKK
jgi:Peptidase family S41/PDZ domain